MDNTTDGGASRRALRRGLSALRRGDSDAAERWLSRAVTHNADNAEAWHYRAIAAHQRGVDENADAWFDHAAALAPERPDFILDRALYLLERGDSAAALQTADSVANDPAHSARATLIGAEALCAGGQLSAAAERLKRFVHHQPQASAARMRLCELLEELGEEEGALEVLREAIARDPTDNVFGPRLAAALRQAGRHEEADTLSRRLADSEPSPAAAWFELAVASAQRGNTHEALRNAEKALQRDRSFGNAWLMLAELSETPEAIGTVLPAGNTAALHFARARLLDRLSRFPEAWEAYASANQLAAREQGPYSPRHQATYVEGLIAGIDVKFVENLQDNGNTHCPTPVFICGVSRSGTTLVEQMLAAHPSGLVRAGGEMRTLHRLLRREIGSANLMETGPRLASMPPDTLKALIEEWRRDLRKHGDKGFFITDKMPSNAFLLGFVHAAFPRAPIILVERDPTALACSCFTTPFAEGHAFSHSLEDIAHYFSQFRRVVMHWENLLPTGAITHLRYENLLAAPREALEPVLTHLGILWDDAMLAFHRRHEPIATASLAQVRTPLNPAAADRWRRFEAQLAPWREELHRAYWNADTANGPAKNDAPACKPGA